MRPLRPLGAIGSTRTRICLCSWIDAAAPPTRVKWYFSVKVTSAAPLPPPCHLRLASTPPAPTRSGTRLFVAAAFLGGPAHPPPREESAARQGTVSTVPQTP